MDSGLFSKINILISSRKIFKNWYLYPIVYFQLTKNKHVIFESKTGLKIKIRVNSTDLMALTHVWLIKEYHHDDFKIETNDVIIDVGAHIGLFALYASQFCKDGKIICYEPIKENYELLLENVKQNKINNIISYNSAVSNSSSTVKIYLNQDESGHSMFLKNVNFVTVVSISLPKILEKNNIENCDFLKLDCEGAEYEIIDSLKEDFFKKIKKTIIEYHLADTNPELLVNLTEKLQAHKFKTKTKKLFSDIGFLFAKSS